jgi:hypothetical protein
MMTVAVYTLTSITIPSNIPVCPIRYPIAAHTIPSINTTFHHTCWGCRGRVRDSRIGSSSLLPPGLCSHLGYLRFQI